MQQAEAAGLVEKVLRRQHGRRLTQAGRDFLDSIDGAYEDGVDSSEWVVKNVPVVEQEVEEVVQDVEEDNEAEESVSDELNVEEEKEDGK